MSRDCHVRSRDCCARPARCGDYLKGFRLLKSMLIYCKDRFKARKKSFFQIWLKLSYNTGIRNSVIVLKYLI